MTIKSFASRIVLITVFGCLMSAGLTSAVAQNKPGQPNLSAEEKVYVMAIMAATEPAAKLKAVADLLKKFPKTEVRRRYAGIMADELAGVPDAARKIALAQDYQKIFTEPSEQDLILPVLIDGYADAGRVDEAFSTGATLLAHQPDEVRVLVQLTLLGTDQARKQNGKFVADSLKYGAKAIELIEADKKPADMDDAGWKQYKSSMLPRSYQTVGVLKVITRDHVGAKPILLKAAELAPTDAYNYLLLGSLLDDDYQNQAKIYQGMPESQAKRDTLVRVLALLDSVIDAYAHMVALSEGNAALQPARQQCLQGLEGYYKYRHNNSTAGMQQLIDKYKVAAKP